MTGLVPTAPAPTMIAGRGISLSRKAKAAIVVRVLLNDGADVPLEELPEGCQEELTLAMGRMRVVDKATVDAVIEEFAAEVDRIGLSFPEGIAGALQALDGKINPLTAARLRKEAGLREGGDPWDQIRQMSNEVLLPILENESTEIAAVMLSKLETKKAAELIGKLPGPQARRIAYAVSLTGKIKPDTVDRIGLSLAGQLSVQPTFAFDVDPVERVGAILNSATSLTRDDVLEGLDEQDEGFAKAVRKAIFTFAHIPKRLSTRDIPRILRDVDQGDLVIAMAGAPEAGLEESANFILENMSGRMADQLREEVGETDAPKGDVAEAAMANIVEVIRNLVAAGEITLIEEEDEDE